MPDDTVDLSWFLDKLAGSGEPAALREGLEALARRDDLPAPVRGAASRLLQRGDLAPQREAIRELSELLECLGRLATGTGTVATFSFVPATPRETAGGPPCILGEHHVTLRVANIERSVHFYTQVLGFRQVRPNIAPPHTAILTRGPWVLGLYAHTRFRGGPPPQHRYSTDHAGLHHLAFALGSPAEVDAAAAWLDTNGVLHKPVAPGAFPDSRLLTFYDPDGIPLEYYFLDAARAELYGLTLAGAPEQR